MVMILEKTEKVEANIKSNRWIVKVLMVLNIVVLSGQIYPEGAPPFARVVNILFLIFSLLFFVWLLFRCKST